MMKKRSRSVVVAICALVAGAGCALEPGALDAGVDMEDGALLGAAGDELTLNGGSINGGSINGSSINGDSINGDSINGDSINGDSINGDSINGATLNGSSINGYNINGTRLNDRGPDGTEVDGGHIVGATAGGSALHGITLQGSGMTSVRVSDGAVLSGAALVGATFAAQMPDGTPMDLRIDALSTTSSDHHPGSVVSRYALSYRVAGSGAWAAVCRTPDGAPAAIPLVGRWNYAQGVPGGGGRLDAPGWITFACSGYALFKCVALGYEPWSAVLGEPLGDHHEACVRLHRADYCGDGRPFTVDGHVINLFDDLGIQEDEATGWALEAEWDEDGARCLSTPRIEGVEPDCASDLPRCGVAPSWGNTLLVSEAP